MKKIIVRGQSVIPGKAEGVVRLIKNHDDADSFKEGEVFVAFTSDPWMVEAMKKACAVIMDVGGTKLSPIHPMFVAKELGIPCILRTRVGTKRLKTGDKVLVDADKGNVYTL